MDEKIAASRTKDALADKEAIQQSPNAYEIMHDMTINTDSFINPLGNILEALKTELSKDRMHWETASIEALARLRDTLAEVDPYVKSTVSIADIERMLHQLKIWEEDLKNYRKNFEEQFQQTLETAIPNIEAELTAQTQIKSEGQHAELAKKRRQQRIETQKEKLATLQKLVKWQKLAEAMHIYFSRLKTAYQLRAFKSLAPKEF